MVDEITLSNLITIMGVVLMVGNSVMTSRRNEKTLESVGVKIHAQEVKTAKLETQHKDMDRRVGKLEVV